MTSKERARAAVALLETAYPDAACSLTYEKPYELIISVRLAAQCTDARVNMVTPALFACFPTLHALAEATPEEIGEIIKSCGLYKTKARDIVALSKMLLEQFDGVVPDTIEELLHLPGVGRKTANLIVGDVYHKPAVVCDTHCIRITNLLGLSTSKDPLKVERELRGCLPMDQASNFCHRLVLHGRAVCIARRPRCDACAMASICDHLHPHAEDVGARTPDRNGNGAADI
ncbi:MAG: endonuclease III [Oscillospiraceae bacterium]